MVSRAGSRSSVPTLRRIGSDRHWGGNLERGNLCSAQCDRIIGGTPGQVDGMAGGTSKREPEEKDRVGPRTRTRAASEESKSRRGTGAADRSPQIHDERGRMGIRARADVIAIVSLEAGPSHRRRVYYRTRLRIHSERSFLSKGRNRCRSWIKNCKTPIAR